MSSESVSIELEKEDEKDPPKYVRFQGKLIPYKKFQRKFAHKPRMIGYLILNFLFIGLLVLFALLLTGIIRF